MTTTTETKTSKTTYSKDSVITTSPARPANSASERLIADLCDGDFGASFMGNSMRQDYSINSMLMLREHVDGVPFVTTVRNGNTMVEKGSIPTNWTPSSN